MCERVLAATYIRKIICSEANPRVNVNKLNSLALMYETHVSGYAIMKWPIIIY